MGRGYPTWDKKKCEQRGASLQSYTIVEESWDHFEASPLGGRVRVSESVEIRSGLDTDASR